MGKSINKKINEIYEANTHRIYVAYGSNLHTGQMAYRCPDAKVVAVGVLEDYKLAFAGWPGHGVATVTPCKGSNVPVALWAISESDEKSLDVYEGWPALYRKEEIEVVLKDGTRATGMVYIMNKKYHDQVMVDALPNIRYFNTIATGYETFGFNKKILNDAYRQTKNLWRFS